MIRPFCALTLQKAHSCFDSIGSYSSLARNHIKISTKPDQGFFNKRRKKSLCEERKGRGFQAVLQNEFEEVERNNFESVLK